MDYKKYVEIVKLEDNTDDTTVEPSESYNVSFTFMPSYYETNMPTMIYIDIQNNDDHKDTLLIVVLSSIACVLFIFFILWYKYNRKKNSTKKGLIKYISREINSIETLDDDFGTIF